MKHRWLIVLPAVALLIGTVACSSNNPTTTGPAGGSAKVGGTVVVYTPNEQTMLDALMPAFKATTGVDYQLVTATTGELYTRIKNEVGNPQGDVMFGDISTTAVANADLYQPYVSANDAAMETVGKNIGGYSTPYQIQCSVLLVNTDKVGSTSITGYADLLQPALKGKIAFGDPTNSSSAFAQLTNMLAAMGGQSAMDANYTSTPAWDFVGKLLQQTGGQVVGSSNQVGQNAANGESVVALTYEPLATNFVKAGSPVKIVYPKEGVSCLPTGVEIIKGAKNLAQAKAFADWMQSEEAQKIIADKTAGRPLRTGVSKEGVPPLSGFTTVQEDLAYVAAHRDAILASYQAALAKAAG